MLMLLHNSLPLIHIVSNNPSLSLIHIVSNNQIKHMVAGVQTPANFANLLLVTHIFTLKK